MEFKLKPDYEVSKKRYDAFWEREILDRPPVSFIFPKENQKPVPEKKYGTLKEKWLDVDFRAEQTAVAMANNEYYADALPVVFPNLGPEIFSAWCGCGYKFGDATTWSEPCVEDWDRDSDKAVFNPEHPLFKLMVRFTQKLIEYAKGNFIVGLTDFHPGGDHIAALRDPQNLAIDMIENIEKVKEKLASSYKEYFIVYDIFYNMLRKAGMPITSWLPLVHEGRYYIPSNDFSCMISNEMFVDAFLPGIIEECRFYEKSIYHLDGPAALRHLDTLLEIKELDAVQWVPGAGKEGFTRWIEVYKRIQQAGKALQVYLDIDELPLLFENLKPEGVWISNISGVSNREAADHVLKRIARWK